MKPSFDLRLLAVLAAIALSNRAYAGEGFQQSVWLTTNHGVHAIEADSGTLLAESARQPQARSVEVDLERGAVWVYGQGRLSRFSLQAELELDLDVPGASPDFKRGNGNGGEKQQDLEIDPETGDVWLGVKRKLYRFTAEGALLEDWDLDSDARALVFNETGAWLLTANALYRVESSGDLDMLPLSVGKSLIELASSSEGALWLAGKDGLFRLNADGEIELELAYRKIRQIAGTGEGGVWIADNKNLIQLDYTGVELARFRHTGRGRTVDLEADPRDDTPWLASQQDIVHYNSSGDELLAVPLKDIADSARIWDISFGIDAISPLLTFLAPEPGVCVATATPSLELTYSDTESGVNPASLSLFHESQAMAANCAAQAGSAICTPVQPLPEGDQTVEASISDHAGNTSDGASLSFHIDTIAPVIEIIAPANGFETFDDVITITGQMSESVPLTVNGTAIQLDSDLRFSVEVALDFGSSVFAFEAMDCAGNASQANLTVTRKRSPPEFVSTPVTEVRAGQTYQYNAIAADPDPDDLLEYGVIQGPDGLVIEPDSGLVTWPTTEDDVGEHTVVLMVTDLNGDSDQQAFIITVLPNNLPPEIVTQPITHVPERSNYTYDVDAVDPKADVLTYSLDRSPRGSHIGADDGQVDWNSTGSEAFSSIRAQNNMCRLPAAPLAGIELAVEWEWHGEADYPTLTHVVQPPLVGQLTDDNSDGAVTAADTPDVVIVAGNHSYRSTETIVIALNGSTGETLWRNPSVNAANRGSGALGDIDHDGLSELVFVSRDRQELLVLETGGTLKWRRDTNLPPGPYVISDTISLADIDRNGTVEIILANQAWSATGELLWEGTKDRGAGGNTSDWGWISVVADVDLDGQGEIIAGRTVYDTDGTVLWHRGDLPGDAYNAVGNFDADQFPEILVAAEGTLVLLNHDGSTVWGPVQIPGTSYRGGPPTIGDVDGDGEPEIGVAGARNFTVFETDGTVKWTYPIADASSASTGSTVFDFNGDNRFELLYADERYFRVFDGKSGRVLAQIPNKSVTAVEYPVLADIDGDREAEILVVSNDGSDTTNGVRAFGSAGQPWVGTRSIWNQHAYSITNVNGDGSIPVSPEPSWLTHNTYRLNAFPNQHVLGQPELAVFDLVLDESVGEISLVAENRGLASTKEGFRVQLFDGDPARGGTLLGETTIESLGAEEDKPVTIDGIDPLALAGPVYAVIDVTDQVVECLEANNAAAAEVIRARATDPGGLFDQQTWLVNVTNVNEAPQIITETLPVAVHGSDYSAAIEVVDPDLGDALRYELVSKPEQLRINEVNGSLTWLADSMNPGTYHLTVRVVDLGGLADQRDYELLVDDGSNDPPVAISQSLSTEEGISIDLTLEGKDPESQVLTYRIVQPPAHGRVIGVPPHLTYIPDAYYDGTDSFQFVVNDGDLDSEPATVDIAIIGKNNPPRIVSEPVTPHVLNGELGELVPQDLRDWELIEFPTVANQGGPSWAFSSDGLIAVQHGNNNPSALMGDFNARNYHIEGTWVSHGSDDDFFGFVIGYRGIFEHYVLRWKKNTQGTPRGISLDLVDKRLDPTEECNNPPFGLCAETLYLNRIAWFRGREYQYSVDFLDGEIRVAVTSQGDLVDAFVVHDDTFTSGRFGPYNYSQANTEYTVSIAPFGADNAYWYDVQAVDPDGDEITYRLLEGPEGLSINPQTGTTYWNTGLDVVGSFPVLIEVEDEDGATAQQQYDLIVQEEQPVITSDPGTIAYVGEQYQYLVSAVDPNPDDVLTYSLVSGPGGASIDSASGMLSWMPGASHLGNHDFAVRVTDTLGLKDEQSFAVEVTEKPSNEPPHFMSEPPRFAYVGQLYHYAPQAVDPDGDPIQYGLVGDLPYHMQIFDGENVTWQPGADQVTEWTVTVDARDGNDGVAEQTFTIQVIDATDNKPPAINSAPITTVEAGVEYSYQIQATDPDGDPLSFTLLESPEGMSVDFGTGLVTWQPGVEEVAFHDVVIRAEDGRGGYAEQEFRLAVVTEIKNVAPVIESSPPTQAVVDSAYQYTVEASDPDDDPLRYALTQSPSDMTIDVGSGLIEWTPSAAQVGEHPVAIEVSDGRGGLATQNYTLTITETGGINQPPTITSQPATTARTGEPYTYQVAASDPDGDSLGYALLAAPAEMTITLAGGLVEWTPGAADIGEYAVSIEVIDGRGGIARQDYTLIVVDGAVNNPPQIISVPPVHGKVGFEYRYQLIAEDPESDTINYTLIEAPAGMSIGSTGDIRWTPQTAGSVTVTARADDGLSYQQQTWTIQVSDASVELSVNVVAQPAIVAPGEPVTITVEASGMAGQYDLLASLDGDPLPLDAANQAAVTLDEIGEHQVIASLSDDFGSVTDQTSFLVRDTSANPKPVVKLIQPGYQQEITAPVDVVGSVADDNLSSWVLAVKPRNVPDAQPRILAEGDSTFPEQVIAPFDTTQLTNGLYIIILQATDQSGQISFDNRVIRVTGDLKVGNFSITYLDVSIPLAGIPIRVTRTYDSRRRFQFLDFGYGWSVGYQNGRVQESRTIGFGWDLYEYDRGFFSEWCVQPNGAPVVTVNLGNGELHSFEAKASPECQDIVPQVDVHIVFEPIDGTDAALEQLDFGLVRLVEGNIVNLDSPDQPIDPEGYRLTTSNGTVYVLDQNFGVEKVLEPGGNYVTFSQAGIVHSSGVGVDFVRDTRGRISEILLPDGESLSYSYDAAGDLVAMTDQLGQSSTYTYDVNFPHYLRDIVDPRGVRVTRNVYDENGRLVATIDADGNRIEYNHNIAGRTSQIRDRRGNLTTYVYDDEGRVLAETNALGETTTHTYNEVGFELTRTNALGQTTSWTYDERGNKLTTTNPLGETTAMTYNAHNRLLSMTAPDGTVVMTNNYNPNSLDLLSATDALGNTTTFVYDSGIGSDGTGQLLSTTNALGHQTIYQYGANGYLTSETDPLGTVTHYVRDNMGRILEERTARTLADGTVQTLVTTYAYDAKGRRIQTTRPDGSVTTTTYNVLDKVKRRCDAGNHCTSYTYDDQGRRIKTTYPDGTTETVAYDALGNEIARTGQAGHATRLVYDAADRLIETIYPDDTPAVLTDNPRETRDYDAAGRLIAATDERGHITTYEYDAAGRRTAVIDPLGHRTTSFYDARGRQVAVMDADGHVSRYGYDDAGRRIATIFPDNTPGDDTDNPRTTYSYDALGRKLAVTDAAGETKRLVYDALGRLVEVIQPDPVTGITPLPTQPGGTRTTYTYDEQGNKRTQTDALGRTTAWAYDEMGRVVSRTLPLGQTEIFSYDTEGNRIAATDFAGQTTTYDYGVMDRRVAIHAPDRDVAMAYTPEGLKRQVTVAAGSTGLEVGTTTWNYDARDRLVSVQYPDGQGISYQYDGAGNRTALTTATGTTAYAFDALNRLATVTAPTGGVTTYTYNAAGDLVQVAYPNGTAQVNTFDARHRLTSRINQGPGGSLITEHHYTLSNDHQRLSLTEADGRLTTWTYDPLDRLIEEQVTDPIRGNRTTTFEYDAVGNRTRTETVCEPAPCDGALTAGVTTYAYDANDQLTNKSAPAGVTTYTYDPNGSLIEQAGAQGLATYGYNSAHRLTEATTPNHSLAFTYDLNGIRQSRTQDGTTTDYLTDAKRSYAEVIAEHDATGNLKARYTHGLDLISQTQAGDTRFYHTDGLGSTRALTDETATPTDTYGYAAYGQSAYQTGATDNPYRYTGEQFDSALSQYYLRARYYNPAVGRFTRMDDFDGWPKVPASLNKYAFVHGNPVNSLDPSGLLTIGNISVTLRIIGIYTAAETAAFLANTASDAGNSNEHFYEFVSERPICSGDIDCTKENVYQLMRRFPAPSPLNPLDPPVINGERIFAYAWVVPIGSVEVTLQPASFTLKNTTIPWQHAMHNGTVTRSLVGAGRISIKTVGEGANFTPVIAFLNDKLGEQAFRALNEHTRRAYQRRYGKD